jgi:hypothetical protein
MADWSKLVLCPECGAANPRDGSLCAKCRTNLQAAIERMESIRQERLAQSKKVRQPQGRRDFKPIDELTVADLERSPVWQYDLDGEGDHDETWVRPVKSLPVTDLSSRVVGTVARLACGEGVFCLLGAISLDDTRRTRQFLGFTAFGKDGERFCLARYFDSDYDSHGPEALAKFWGRRLPMYSQSSTTSARLRPDCRTLSREPFTRSPRKDCRTKSACR